MRGVRLRPAPRSLWTLDRPTDNRRWRVTCTARSSLPAVRTLCIGRIFRVSEVPSPFAARTRSVFRALPAASRSSCTAPGSYSEARQGRVQYQWVPDGFGLLSAQSGRHSPGSRSDRKSGRAHDPRAGAQPAAVRPIRKVYRCYQHDVLDAIRSNRIDLALSGFGPARRYRDLFGDGGAGMKNSRCVEGRREADSRRRRCPRDSGSRARAIAGRAARASRGTGSAPRAA